MKHVKTAPAVSESQRNLMGMAYAYDKGDLALKDIPEGARDKVKSIADSMKSKDLSDFAHTKHKGLPKRKTFIIDKIMKEAQILQAPSVHNLEECLEELKFGRPAKQQDFLDSCIDKINQEK